MKKRVPEFFKSELCAGKRMETRNPFCYSFITSANIYSAYAIMSLVY